MDDKTCAELVLRPPTEEFLVESELHQKIETGEELRHYVGYELSGLVHLGTLITAFKVADLQKAGAKTQVFMADFHTIINQKLGGDAKFIRRVAREYFGKTMGLGIKIAGGNPGKTDFILASDIYDQDYWATVIKAGNETTLSRALRSLTIMGREERAGVPTAWVMYPLMQAADILHQGVNLAHAGMDQRKIHVITREIGQKVAGYKPMCLHNHMLLGLHKPAVWPVPKDKEGKWGVFKMSKSLKGSAVYANDSEEEIRKKIDAAFCPAKGGYNPVLDWAKHIAFAPQLGGVLSIERPQKFGGDVEYPSYGELEKDFSSGKLHPSDLKKGLAEFVVKLLEPVRKEFRGNKLVEELKARVIR